MQIAATTKTKLVLLNYTCKSTVPFVYLRNCGSGGGKQ